MTDTVETNPELNALIWETLIAEGNAAAKKRSLERAAEAVEFTENSNALFAAFFHRNPSVRALAWSQTTAEYDDESYGGYNFTEMRPNFFDEGRTPEETQWIDDASMGGFTSSYRYNKQMPDSLLPAMTDVEILGLLMQLNMDLLVLRFGEQRVCVTRNGFTTYTDNDLGWGDLDETFFNKR